MLVNNPIIYMDMPDMDIIRVKDMYYMVSTTMFMMPGAPILKSKNLCDWEIVSYIFSIIEDNDIYNLMNGNNAYGKGQWATSLKYYEGMFYASFVCHDMGKTYIYYTDDIERSNWQRFVIDEVFHDMSIFIYEKTPYLIYGNGEINIVELEADLSKVKKNGLRQKLFSTPKQGIGLRCEGCRAYEIDGYIYLLFIEWPIEGNARRRQVCYRAKRLIGPYERKVILDDDMGYFNQGIAQGVLIDSEQGEWYSMLFQDHGAVGRIPYLMPVKWENGWPVLGINHKVPRTFNIPFAQESRNDLITSDSFDHASNELDRRWEWNHNPQKANWSFTKRKGYLCLTTDKVSKSILETRNILTQKTIGPKCSCEVELDVQDIREGDIAGIMAFQGTYGVMGVRAIDAFQKEIVLIKRENGNEYIEEKVGLQENRLWLRIDFDFTNNNDKAFFYYATEEQKWISLGQPLQMKYTLDLFIGYRIGILYSATQKSGGNVYYRDFRYIK